MMEQPAMARLLRSPTSRLVAAYLSIIMVISIGFSLAFYYTCVHELRHMLFASFVSGGDGHILRVMVGQSTLVLRDRLILLNLAALLGGALLSYYFTRRTLGPIENAMAAQSRFVTDASHELRTPLTALLAMNEVALRKPRLTISAAKEVIGGNVAEITKLKGLTDGLLNLAKQETSVLNSHAVSIQDVAGEAMNRVVSAAQAKHIAIEDSTPTLAVLGDMDDLVQSVVILLDNAIKYSPAQSTIYLTGYRKDKRVGLAVRDEGAGIDARDLPHIFERFYRADVSRTQSDSQGYGIGLSIAKKIIEQYGGRILASSTGNQGSTFTIELPLAVQDAVLGVVGRVGAG
jgi:two-component system sensor histidine kinase CiaH